MREIDRRRTRFGLGLGLGLGLRLVLVLPETMIIGVVLGLDLGMGREEGLEAFTEARSADADGAG